MLLRTFGGPSIEAAPGEGPTPSLSPRRLALLALVAAAGPRGITREKILGTLWADTDEEQARHTLSQNLYLLRRDTGREWITGGAQLRLHDSIRSDVREFQDALRDEQLARAAELYAGPFLDGFYLPGAPEFEQWVEETRARLQFAALKAMETLAEDSVEAGSVAEVLHWWRRLGAIDPFSAQYAIGQLRTLIATGDQTGALRFAREYESRVRRELDAEPDPLVAELTAPLRSAPRPLPPTAAPAPTSASGAAPPAPPTAQNRPVAQSRRRFWIAAAVVAALVTAGIVWSTGAPRSTSATAPPFLAIGSIQSRDSAVLAPLFRDMLATNLARIGGLQVVSNSRLLELLPRADDTVPSASADAARRAGASEIVEGELGVAAGELVLTLRRVALRSGRVVQGYTVRARDLYALTDSATAAIASDFQVDAPPNAVATVRTTSAVAYALYEQGLRAYYEGDSRSAIPLMTAALARDSTFAMAAFYAWLSTRDAERLEDANRLLPVVKRLASRAVDRERLLIDGMVANTEAPLSEFLAVARRMTERFPEDPDGQILLGNALFVAGDWGAAVAAFDRSVAIDSAAGATSGPYCRACQALYLASTAYVWWDSLAAAERTMRRLIALRPNDGAGSAGMVEGLLRQGRRGEAEAAIARAFRMTPVPRDFGFLLDRDLIRTGRLDELQVRLVSELRSAARDARGETPWLLAFTLRNQGRLREAWNLASDGVLPRSDVRLAGHRDLVSLAIVALERGQPRESSRRFLDMVVADRAHQVGAGTRARNTTWHMTLAGTALASAGDTAAVRALADSVERIGANSSFGRDHRLHHFLRGLLLQLQNRHAEAVESFRRSLFSLTDGYTRTNLELARSLMVLRRYPEAIAVLRPALRGGVDGGNTYVTHTELHEALAHAFLAAGQRDSAAVHYAAVERAWRFADPELAERYRTAKARATPTH